MYVYVKLHIYEITCICEITYIYACVCVETECILKTLAAMIRGRKRRKSCAISLPFSESCDKRKTEIRFSPSLSFCVILCSVYSYCIYDNNEVLVSSSRYFGC